MQVLLIVGFFLHALPMNVVLGGGFLASILFLIGRSNQASYCYRTAKALAVSLPLFISFAVTQGIVPLLFLQLLYGPAFYTSSILMAVPWLGVLGVLLISYYISYLVIYRILKKEYSQQQAMHASCWLLAMSIGFAAIGYLFSNNMTLMLTPQKWLAIYAESARGFHLNAEEPQLIPRYLHFFVASVAVAGMTIGCFGLYLLKRERQFADWMIKLGSKIFLVSTIVQIPIGLWFLKSIPDTYAAAFLGSDVQITAVFMVSMSLVLLAIVATSISSTSGNRQAFIAGLACNALLILAMIINRHQLRLLYLNSHVKPEAINVSTQWDLLAIFLISAVALILYLVWLCRLVWKAYTAKQLESTT